MHLPLTYDQISKILPHRYPFLLVDRVVALEKGKSIKAIKNVSANEPFFNGHFPGFPVMPGVLQIEALAQAAGILAFFSGHFDADKQVAFLAGVDQVRFKKPVRPGDRLDLSVELGPSKRSLFKASGIAHVDGEVASMADIMIVVQDK